MPPAGGSCSLYLPGDVTGGRAQGWRTTPDPPLPWKARGEEGAEGGPLVVSLAPHLSLT